MSKNAPFSIGQKVVCVDDGWTNRLDFDNAFVKKDGIYTVSKCTWYPRFRKWYIKVEEDPCEETNYWAKRFAPYNPYSNSVSKELAEKAMSVGDGADQPIKIKELQTANN